MSRRRRRKRQYTVYEPFSLRTAVDIGYLVDIGRQRKEDLSGGVPIYATAAVADDFSIEDIIGIWEKFAAWTTRHNAHFPLGGEIFCLLMHANQRDVWVLELKEAFLIMYAES